jgi:hypothetical protein
MTLEEIEGTLNRMRYDHDDRQPPDNLRRGQFKAGWKAAAAGVRYNEQTLVRLTWNNLGYRLGLAFGAQAVQDIEWAFTLLAKRYVEPPS